MGTTVEICQTDLRKIIKYLTDAAVMYDNLPGRRNSCRAWMIRQLIKKINKKLVTHKTKGNDKK